MAGTSDAGLHVAIDARVVQDHFPGISRYVYSLTEALVEVAPDWTFTLLHDPQARSTRFSVARLAASGSVRVIPVEASVFSLRQQFAVPGVLAASRPDVWHATYYVTAYLPGRPMVLTAYDVISVKVPGSLQSEWKRAAFGLTTRLALRAAQHVITLSNASKRDLIQHYGVPPDKVGVVYPAAAARFHPQTDERVSDVRRRYNLPEVYVLYLGSDKPHKNVPLLIEAWRRLLSAGNLPAGAQLVLAGHTDLAETSYASASAALADVTTVLSNPPEDDLPALYSGASLFAYPSLYEGFGLPVLEAMACGCPVIASAASCLPEVVGDAGLLLDPHDVEAWASALHGLLADRQARQVLARQGLERAARFSWPGAASDTLDVYRRCARQAVRRAAAG
jgi:alpha-1,3-rhamnosyl/mannosyltransferase